jgi:glutamyl-tRNA reductase
MRERDRALHRLSAPDEQTKVVIDDLSRVLIKKLLSDLTLSIRSSAEHGDIETADSLVQAIIKGERICFRKEE